jgi:type IV pilus assembly protein PilB
MAKNIIDNIIQTLIDLKRISQKDLKEAMKLQKKKNCSLSKILIDKGFIKEGDLFSLFVRELNIPFINLSKYKLDPALKEMVPERVARRHHIVPLSATDSSITVAMSDPLNVFAIDDLRNITFKEVDVVMSTHADIAKTITHFYEEKQETSVSEITQDMQIEDFEIVSEQETAEDMGMRVDESEKAPIVRMVNLLLKEALKQGASDIHIEPTLEGMRVRFRIDGLLKDIFTIPKENQNAVIVRMKIMARLDITTTHIPQDGRFKLKVTGREVDFRVSLLPTTFGQKVVLRVLDKNKLKVGLNGLGFLEQSLEKIKEAIRKPFGMILVTGPTGSGKSTSLYSMINVLNTVDRNIITVEDPVEYLVDGLTQIQAYPEIGLTFAEGLRSILRQSPDIVMVGEIRDNETADIAIKASLTGQLVLSTLHTNDAAGALTRLVNMGVEPFLVASSLVLVSAQRLCRRICVNCKQELEDSDKIIRHFHFEDTLHGPLYAGAGCEACNFTGYKGRMGITEILEVDDEVQNMLLGGKTSDDIKEYARKKQGMMTLWEDALKKCSQGMTTLEEVLRVTAND